MMNSQMLKGGHKIEETIQFQNAVEEHIGDMAKKKKEFDQRLIDLEKERIKLEEGQSKVESYKELLIKQRDIMVALTSRLNERDEHNNQLQEELDDYDRINKYN